MRARMNRKILLSYLKSMVRVVPQSNSIMELMGFMIECNEDEGVVYITVLELSSQMQRYIKINFKRRFPVQAFAWTLI